MFKCSLVHVATFPYVHEHGICMYKHVYTYNIYIYICSFQNGGYIKSECIHLAKQN